MVILYLICLIVSIIIQYYVAKQFQSVAEDKGYEGDRFFHLPFWLGLPGWILIAALPDRNNTNNPTIIDEDSKPTITPPSSQPPKPVITYTEDTAIAILSGCSNVKCSNCNQIQFKGNIRCNCCGAKFVKVETEE